MKLEDGSVLASPLAIHEEAITYFNNFLRKQPNKDNPNFITLILDLINEVDNNFQLLEPSKVELK